MTEWVVYHGWWGKNFVATVCDNKDTAYEKYLRVLNNEDIDFIYLMKENGYIKNIVSMWVGKPV